MKSQSYEFLKGFENNHINIGFGSYGQVRLAKNTETKELVAIKLQIAVHTRLEHPNIIRLLNYYYQKEKNITYMVLEYADGGTLFEKTKTSNMTKEQIRKIFRDIVEAVKFLHKNGVMHRDIKTENILLTKKLDAKICDFGFAALCGQRKTLCGTYEYMAPEMIQNMIYDHKIDIWALGILLFEMIEGVAPFRGETPEEVLAEMKKAIYFSQKFTKEQIALVKSILRVNPGNRPSAAQILENSYFAGSSEKDNKSLPSTHSEVSASSTHASINRTMYEHKTSQRSDSPPNTRPTMYNPLQAKNMGLHPQSTASVTASNHLSHMSMQQQSHKNMNLSGVDYRVPMPPSMLNNPVGTVGGGNFGLKDFKDFSIGGANTSISGGMPPSSQPPPPGINSSFQNWRRN